MLSYELSQPTLAGPFDEVLNFVQNNSEKWSDLTPKAMSRALGQIFSPIAMSQHLSRLIPESTFRNMKTAQVVSDPGTGTGILSLSLSSRIHQIKPCPF
jgi:adenine-specific DNA-methyltransferase